MRSVFRPLPTLLALLGFGLVLAGCDSGTSMTEELPPEEAQTQMETADRDLSSDVDALVSSGEFATTVQGLFSTATTTTSGKTHQQPLGFTLIDHLDTELETTDGRLDFGASTGVYEWDPQEGDWVYAGSSDSIVLKFPASEDAPGNNATFTLSAYSDTGVVIDGTTEYLPARISASLTVEGTGEVFAVELLNTTFYDSQVDGSQVPKSFFLDILTAPHRHTYEWSSPSKQEFEFAVDLAEGDRLVLGLLANVALKSDFDQVSGPQGIDELSGEINLGPDVTIDYTLQVDELAALSGDPTAEQVNNRISAMMKYRGQKMGDLRFGQNGPLLVYNDGTTEPLEQVFDNTLASLAGSSAGGVTNAITGAVTTATQTVRDAVSAVF
jgi:hypothetical protein